MRTTLPSSAIVISSASVNLIPLPSAVLPVFNSWFLSLYLGKISITSFLAVKSFCISSFVLSSSTSRLTNKVEPCLKSKRNP